MEADRGISHRCLHVADIQAMIFKFLAREDCARLSRTCTLFYNEAMNVVWADVISLIPFVKCMSPDAVVESKSGLRPFMSDVTLDFCRELTTTDWQAFCKHAHRVRKFVDSTRSILVRLDTYRCPWDGHVNYSLPEGATRLTAGAWETITRFIRQHHAAESAGLFPNLTTLEAQSDSDTWFTAYLPYICGDTLRKLTLQFGMHVPVDAPRGEIDTFSCLLPAMCASWPLLSSVKIITPLSSGSCPSPVDKHAEEIGAWLKSLPQLRSLHADIACHPAFVKTLSELSNLRTLTLLCARQIALDLTLDFPTTSLDTLFPSLEVLNVTTHTPDSPVPFLRVLNGSSTLTKITLDFDCLTNQPSFIQAPFVLEAISHLPAVDFLDLSFGNYSRPNDPIPEVPPLSTALFSKLFHLHNMRHLKLEGFFNILITDRDLRSAATLWPELEHIYLVLASCDLAPSMVNDSSALTLIGVQALYNGCPNLKAVDLPINESLLFANDCLDLPAARPRGAAHAVEELSLRFRPIDGEMFRHGSAKYVPIVVRLLFPHLKQLKTCHSAIDEVWSPARSNSKSWGKRVQTSWEKYRDMELGKVRERLEWKLSNERDC
ncbi:hypothetical protein BDY19DRAFT_673863 [Irpex rosettiformis]|uniref:Uncharacterized protein n=1 Tax=Irpex rosettiformis TaxID=378272 RepID=A0ACB8U9P1_9APHY|nr:hypothetical protein BDY19DRAFT_673863 [Irpex rosettiformis]